MNKHFTKREVKKHHDLEFITKEEKKVMKFLEKEAIDVLEATGKGFTINHLDSARKLIKLYKEL